MLGILLFVIYILLGILLAHFLFERKKATVRLWLGIVFGTVGLMWSHVPFSFMMGFTIASHICGLILFAALTAAIGVLIKKKRGYVPNPLKDFRSTWLKDITASDKWMFAVLVIFMLLAVILLFNHTLYEIDGGYYTGQSTYGDMNFHLGIITGVAEQETFPPDYNIFPGAKLDYYFFCDSVSSSLYKFGTGLKMAYILPMLAAFAAVFAGFWILADTMLNSRKKTLLAFLFFFLNGGLGTFYLLDKEKFSDIFFGYYCTPTNYRFKGDGETTIVWTNAIADMMLPQRATLFGWMAALAIFYLLYLAVFDRERENFLPAGILTGLSPMIQTYTFFAVGLVALCWLIYTFTQVNKKVPSTLKDTVLDWVKFGIPAVVLAIPQFLIWIFGAVSGESFLNISFNAYNEAGDNWLWFWIKNVGVVFVLIFPAFIMASKKMKAIYSGALLIFVTSELVVFQTLAYDNNKLYFMWYLFSCILVADWIFNMLERVRRANRKAVSAAVLAVTVVLSSNAAVLTIAREVISGFPIKDQFYCSIGIYGSDQVAACDFIKENTDPKSTVLAYYNHNNAISSLTGRNIYCGAATFLYSHGLDYTERQELIQEMFSGGEAFEENKDACGIDYVYISATERDQIEILNESYFKENYPLIYSEKGVNIYDVRG